MMIMLKLGYLQNIICIQWESAMGLGVTQWTLQAEKVDRLFQDQVYL